MKAPALATVAHHATAVVATAAAVATVVVEDAMAVVVDGNSWG
jgi:hypothetical protein